MPRSRVRHLIPAQRQTLRYVYSYFKASGETVAYLEQTWPGEHHPSANLREIARASRSRAQLSAVEGRLLDPAIYDAARAGERTEALRQQGAFRKRIAAAEEAWLVASEALEAMRTCSAQWPGDERPARRAGQITWNR